MCIRDSSDSELAFGLENQGMTRGEILRRLDDTTDRLHLKRLRGRNLSLIHI